MLIPFYGSRTMVLSYERGGGERGEGRGIAVKTKWRCLHLVWKKTKCKRSMVCLTVYLAPETKAEIAFLAQGNFHGASAPDIRSARVVLCRSESLEGLRSSETSEIVSSCLRSAMTVLAGHRRHRALEGRSLSMETRRLRR